MGFPSSRWPKSTTKAAAKLPARPSVTLGCLRCLLLQRWPASERPGRVKDPIKIALRCPRRINLWYFALPRTRTRWGPPVISWLITPSKYSYLRIKHQLVIIVMFTNLANELGPHPVGQLDATTKTTFESVGILGCEGFSSDCTDVCVVSS